MKTPYHLVEVRKAISKKQSKNRKKVRAALVTRHNLRLEHKQLTLQAKQELIEAINYAVRNNYTDGLRGTLAGVQFGGDRPRSGEGTKLYKENSSLCLELERVIEKLRDSKVAIAIHLSKADMLTPDRIN